MKQNRIAISFTTLNHLKEATDLSSYLQLELLFNPNSVAAQAYDYLLLFTPHYLGLQKVSDKKCTPFYIDFLSPQMRYRCARASLRHELVARAMGLRPSANPYIIDATAGLGRDSFMLSILGFHVTAIERSPIIYALLQDALNRCVCAVTQHPNLIFADAIDCLKKLSHDCHPDIIYMDPMFPERSKSALVKKEMIILQNLLGKEDDTDELFNLALSCAKYRVVVKRPKFASNIAECAPNFVITGRSSRFDVYLV